MVCSACHTDNSAECDCCSTCGASLHSVEDDNATRLVPSAVRGTEDSLATQLHVSAEAATQVASQASTDNSQIQGWSAISDQRFGMASGEVCLLPGTILGGRYEIQKTLGTGGMGSVYKARDREVDRLVAIKIIRPELANDPNILQRFKQELVLARQVTHRNVVRIYDLGVSDGLRFISMEYIDGRELSEVLADNGKLEPRRAAEIVLQVVSGLEAAHTQGVIHRDLKPQNIMLDKTGRAAVMDFGIASSIGIATDSPETSSANPSAESGNNGNLTMVGSLLGTPRYMSPEQARRESVDARSDIFTLGIIFYEMLTGKLPFVGKTVKETLLNRTTNTAVPPVQLDKTIPKRVNDIVVKCLQTDPERRYQTTTDLVNDLEIWLGIRSGVGAHQMARWKIGAAVMAALAVLTSGFVLYQQSVANDAKPHDPVKVLISDFHNDTGNPLLNSSVEPMMQVALEGASFITAFNRGQAHDLAAKLKPGLKALDDNTARLIGIREGLNVVVDGSIQKDGDGFRLSATALEPAKGTTIVSKDASFSSPNELSKAVDTVAGRIRRALGDRSRTSSNTAAETFTSTSLGSAQKYAEAQQYQWEGKWENAVESYREALKLDPNMSRAYAGLAAMLSNLGNRQEAEKDYKQALAHIDRESDREKFRTRGGYYLMERDYQNAADQFRQLVKAYPADSAGLANLALAYFYGRNMTAALEEGRKAVQIYPSNLLQRNNLGLYAMYAGDFDTAIKESQEIIAVNPQFEKAYLCMGLAQLAKGALTDAISTYQKMAALTGWGASEAHLALADAALYQGRFSNATRELTDGIKLDLDRKNTSAAATKLIALGEAQLDLGQPRQALESVEKAVSSNDDDTILYGAASVDIAAGDKSRADAIAAKLNSRFGPEPQALTKLIQGQESLASGKTREAVSSFQEAQKLDDTWLGRYQLGRAYLQAKLYPDADGEFDMCLKRIGEATAVYLDDEPSLRYLPPVYYYQGLARAGLHSLGADEDFKKFVAIKQESEHDPLVSDARKRLNVTQ